MKRLILLLGAVLALAGSSTAAADTFIVVRPHNSTATGFSTSNVISFSSAPGASISLAKLRGIWQAAGASYGIPWEVLAAINKVETNFGRNLGPSSAGAIGWMQFLPSTWARWGIDANGDGVADPNNPTDAIFSAARYLAACGGQTDIAAAIYCYNHADWYVNEVLGLAALYAQSGGNGLFSLDRLQLSVQSARSEVTATHAQLAAARVQARKLALAQQRLLHVAATARLISDRLNAGKRAAVLGARRSAVIARMARLRDVLHTATFRLSSAQSRTGGLQLGRIDQGVDVTSGSPFLNLAAGTVAYIDPNFWRGTPAVYVKLDTPITVGGRTYDEIYYSETKALVHVGQRLLPGEPVIAAGGAEIGFAKGNLPAAHGTYHDGQPTEAGSDFYTYLAAGASGGSNALFVPLGGSVVTFQQGAVPSLTFTPSVVYFTH